MSDTPKTEAFAATPRALGTGYYQALDFARDLEKQLERAMSLVRLCRSELHQQNAITDKEYADLLQQPELRTVLETHDDLRAEIAELKAEAAADAAYDPAEVLLTDAHNSLSRTLVTLDKVQTERNELRILLQNFMVRWQQNYGRFLEGMGDTNPRVASIQEVYEKAGELLAKP